MFITKHIDRRTRNFDFFMKGYSTLCYICGMDVFLKRMIYWWHQISPKETHSKAVFIPKIISLFLFISLLIFRCSYYKCFNFNLRNDHSTECNFKISLPIDHRKRNHHPRIVIFSLIFAKEYFLLIISRFDTFSFPWFMDFYRVYINLLF